MLTKELSSAVKVTQVITPTAGAAGTSAINGSTIDMANFEGVGFLIQLGAIVAGAVTSVKVQQGAAANMSDAADLEGTGYTIADSDDEKVLFINVHKPRERYVRVVVSRGTQDATIAGASALQYGPRTLPVASHGATVLSESHVSPAEGTA